MIAVRLRRYAPGEDVVMPESTMVRIALVTSEIPDPVKLSWYCWIANAEVGFSRNVWMASSARAGSTNNRRCGVFEFEDCGSWERRWSMEVVLLFRWGLDDATKMV